MSNEERQLLERWEQGIQEEEERVRKEQEQDIRPTNLTQDRRRLRQIICSRKKRFRLDKQTTGEEFRRKNAKKAQNAEVDSEPVIKAPCGKKPNRVLTAEEQQVWDTWEQKIDEEEKKLREEHKQCICPYNLTKDQQRLRRSISRRKRKRRLEGKIYSPQRRSKEKVQNTEIDSEPVITAPRGKKPNRILTAEEQRVWDTWEQSLDEVEKRIREERKQHILPWHLTKEQKRMRNIVHKRIRHRAVQRESGHEANQSLEIENPPVKTSQ
ncbi:hypothetical protein MMC22_007153 [Lobaria immixta]|nr:hypothetical protein [Lobaria immixta]